MILGRATLGDTVLFKPGPYDHEREGRVVGVMVHRGETILTVESDGEHFQNVTKFEVNKENAA